MEEYVETIEGAAVASGMYESIHAMFGNTLSDEMIHESIIRSCEFFHIDEPAGVVRGGSVGVYTLNPDIMNDDVMVFNREELWDLGISDQNSLDLIMTHEGAHRMLQGINADFNSHQEELCCDFMSGVCAELNDIDVDAIKTSLADITESETHPEGALRIIAIENGMEFANEYMQEHGFPPTWTEAYEHFCEDITDVDVPNYVEEETLTNSSENFMDKYDAMVERQDGNNREEDFKQHYERMVADESENHLAFKGAPLINDRKYYEKKAESDLRVAKNQEKYAEDALKEGRTDDYKQHMRSAKIYHESAKKNLDLAKKCTK